MPDKQIKLESKLFKGFADQSRLSILKALLKGPKTVSDISKATKLSQPNTSIHLACLLECGLLRNEKLGREVFYEISVKEVSDIIGQVQKVLKKHSKEIINCKTY